MSKRFSKSNFRAKLEEMAEHRAEYYGFDPGNGWNQVASAPIDKIVEYGRYAQLLDLIEELQ
jgi:hypothetical protein